MLTDTIESILEKINKDSNLNQDSTITVKLSIGVPRYFEIYKRELIDIDLFLDVLNKARTKEVPLSTSDLCVYFFMCTKLRYNSNDGFVQTSTSEIAYKLNMQASNVSFSLKRLIKADLISTDENKCYCINQSYVDYGNLTQYGRHVLDDNPEYPLEEVHPCYEDYLEEA